MDDVNKPKNRWAIGTCITAVMLAAGAGGAAWWQYTPPPPAVAGPPEAIVQFAASERFKALPSEQRQQYVDRLEKLTPDERRALGKAAGLTPEQGRAAYKNLYDQGVRHRIEHFYTLKTAEEKNAYLDKLIEEFKKEQAFHKTEPMDPSKVKGQLESVPAADRARAAGFLQAFIQRGIIRGLGFGKASG